MIDFKHVKNGRSKYGSIWSRSWSYDYYGSSSIWTAWQRTFQSTRRIKYWNHPTFSYFSIRLFYIFMAYDK